MSGVGNGGEDAVDAIASIGKRERENDRIELPYRGMKIVSNYQRVLIQAVIEHGGNAQASKHLGINIRTLENALYRAYKALKVTNVGDAYYLIKQGINHRD